MKLISHADFPEDSVVPKSVQEEILVLSPNAFFEQPLPGLTSDKDEVLFFAAKLLFPRDHILADVRN